MARTRMAWGQEEVPVVSVEFAPQSSPVFSKEQSPRMVPQRMKHAMLENPRAASCCVRRESPSAFDEACGQRCSNDSFIACKSAVEEESESKKEDHLCQRCGCRSQFDKFGDRVCWCDACHKGGCIFDDEFHINFVRGLGGETFSITAKWSWTFRDLQEAAEEATSVPRSQQKLVHGSPPTELSPARTSALFTVFPDGPPSSLAVLRCESRDSSPDVIIEYEDDLNHPMTDDDDSAYSASDRDDFYREGDSEDDESVDRYLDFIEARAQGRADWEDYHRYMNGGRFF